MKNNIEEEIKELQKKKLIAKIEYYKISEIKLIIIRAMTTVLTASLIIGITWCVNYEYISLSLDTKRLKLEKENLEMELHKDSLSRLAQNYLDSAINLKKQIEIRELKNRTGIVSSIGLTEFKILFDFNKSIQAYNENNNPNELFSVFVKNIKLIDDVSFKYDLYSGGEQIKDTLNYLWNENKLLWKKIVPILSKFHNCNSNTSSDSIESYISDFKNIFQIHNDKTRNLMVDKNTGILEILKVPGSEKEEIP